MKKLTLVAGGIAGLFLVLLVSIGLIAACVVHSGHSFSIGQGEKSTRQESHPLEIQTGGLLSVEVDSGDIRVRAAEGESATVDATITAWGETVEDARLALERARLEITTTSGGVRVTLAEGKTEKTKSWGTVTYGAEVELAIRLPKGVRLDLETGSGSLRAEGPFAASTLRSAYGDVRVRDVEGALEATSESGDVEIERVQGDGEVRVKSGYGDVRLGQCHADRVDARSGSGSVRLQEVEAKTVRSESGYGDVELLRVAGEIEAKTSSGDVRASEIGGAKASFSTSYGNVRVEKASGDVDARSSSGDVRVTGFEGAIEARSSYGSVEVEGVLTALVADTQSGDVIARALAGSRVESTWKLSSSYGDVTLVVPEGFACDLDARTEYGAVEVDVPLHVAAGELKSAKESVRGKLNGGGGAVEIRCSSGDVAVGTSGK